MLLDSRSASFLKYKRATVVVEDPLFHEIFLCMSKCYLFTVKGLEVSSIMPPVFFQLFVKFSKY
jgi:hypothetical protein